MCVFSKESESNFLREVTLFILSHGFLRAVCEIEFSNVKNVKLFQESCLSQTKKKEKKKERKYLEANQYQTAMQLPSIFTR